MPAAALPPDEAERLIALERYAILDTMPEAQYDELTLLASQICGTPISLISIIAEDRQWFKSRRGIDLEETPRALSFCAYTIHSDSVFEVVDASADERFLDNPFVTGEAHVRFYAGAPLVTPDGWRLGTLCVIDNKPRHLSAEQRQALSALARQVMTQLELRRTVEELERTAVARELAFTRLEQQGRELRESREEFERFMDNSPILAFIKDREGRYLYCNTFMRTTFDLRPGQLIGVTDFDWLPFDIASAVHANDVLVMEKHQAVQALENVPTPDNPECQWLILKFPVGEGETMRLGGVALDLSELRRAEKLKDEFVSVVSHELRTPLTAIRGALGLLANNVAGDLPADAQEMVSIANKNADRLGLLIDDLLDIEKIQSGKMHFRMAPLSLVQLLGNAVEVNSPYAATLGATLIIEPLPADLHGARLQGDFNRLTQVLTNLLSNGAKYTRPGGRVWLSAHRVEVEGAVERAGVRIEVRDEGAGVPAEFACRLFERFAQADSSATRRQGGTGLGLAVSRAIIEKHGTHIGYLAPTTPEEGATFFFDLKLVSAQ